MNPYLSYYNNQVGTGLAGFQGLRYQKGHGWFGRLFTSVLPFIKQVLPVLGKRALPSGKGLAQDILSGENVGRSAVKRLKEAGRNIADESVDMIKTKLLQSGSGGKCHVKFTTRRRSKKKTPKNNKKGSKKRKQQPQFLQ
jgi:hypothetical protein